MKILLAPTIYIKNLHQMNWLRKSLKSLKESNIDFDLVAFVNEMGGYGGEIVELFDEVITNEENKLSKSWNRAVKYGLDNGYDYIVIPNLDIIVRSKTLGNLVEFAQERGGVMWSGYCTNRSYDLKPEGSFRISSIGQNNWDSYALFMVNGKLFERVGEFDEHYQAYCEDVDMEHRIGLAGETHWCVSEAPFFHHENVTLQGYAKERESDMLRENNNGALEYFIRKWGGPPRSQTYQYPFNNSNLSYKDTK